MVDTTPLMSKYRNESQKYPDACKQDNTKQLAWVDSVLTSAKEDWVIVVGHHPIYAETPKDSSERKDMQNTLGKVLAKHKNVAMYLCGRKFYRLYSKLIRVIKSQSKSYQRNPVLQS